MAKYMTPDFDVTIYDIQDRIAIDVGPGDPDDGFGSDNEGLSNGFSGELA